MIDWVASEAKFGTTREACKKASRVSVVCDKCGATGEVGVRSKAIALAHLPWNCKQCQVELAKPKLAESSRKMWEDPGLAAQMLESRRTDEYKENQRAKALDRYQDSSYRNKVADANRASLARPEVRAKLSESTASAWQDEAKSARLLAGVRSVKWTDQMRAKASEATKAQWLCPTYRTAMSTGSSRRAKALWADQAYRAKHSAGLAKSFTPERRAEISAASRANWNSSDFRSRVTNSIALRHEFFSEYSSVLWRDKGWRGRVTAGIKLGASVPERLKRRGENSRAMWADPENRARFVATFNSEEHRAKMAAIQANQPKVSKPQMSVYSILDDLGVQYYREYNDRPDDPQCVIGPYSFDCVVPRAGRTTLLLEIQGDYWHSIAKNKARDTRKQSYIQNNLSHQYELKHIWEHELLCGDRVSETIKYWLGVDRPLMVAYALRDVVVKPAPAADYNQLLAKYHYLVSAGTGGTAIGAYVGDVLAAVAVFSRLPRKNLPYDYVSTRELSRLCVHPAYRQKNLVSWFMSRAIGSLPDTVEKIVSYCDTTFNHTGAVYRACNFRLDGETPRDYWYVNESGWVMHKRTLYNQAVKCGKTEAEFADSFGYRKVMGEKKLRFILER